LNPLDVTIEGLPGAAPDPADSMIALECSGGVVTHPARLLQPELPVDPRRPCATQRGRIDPAAQRPTATHRTMTGK
jgi:hypothetical protein